MAKKEEIVNAFNAFYLPFRRDGLSAFLGHALP